VGRPPPPEKKFPKGPVKGLLIQVESYWLMAEIPSSACSQYMPVGRDDELELKRLACCSLLLPDLEAQIPSTNSCTPIVNCSKITLGAL